MGKTIAELRAAVKANSIHVDDLKAARVERLDEAAPLIDKAKADDRPMLASEQRAFDKLMAESDEIDGMVNRLELESRARMILPEHRAGSLVRGSGTGNGTRDRELRIMGENLFAHGGVLVPEQVSAEVWEHLSADAVLLKAGARVIETTSSELLIPRLDSDSVAEWTGEGVAITESSPPVSGSRAIMRKCASIVRVSNELFADSNPSVLDLLMRQLTRSLSLAVDLAGFEGTGTTYQPKGMSGQATNQNIGLGADGAVPGDIDEIADAIGSIETANGKASAIFMHPAIWAILSKIKTDSAATRNEPLLLNTVGVDAAPLRRLYGVPVYLSSQLSTTEVQGSSAAVCSSIYVCDMSQILFVRNGQLRLELDRSRLFNSDESEVRAVLRADWIFPNPTAITRIRGVKQA